MPERYLSASDVARVLRVVPSAVTNWRNRGTGPLPEPAAYVGDRPLWRLADIRALVEERYIETMLLLDAYGRGDVVDGQIVKGANDD